MALTPMEEYQVGQGDVSFGSAVDITSSTSSATRYTFPKNGYIRIIRKYGSTGNVQLNLNGYSFNIPPSNMANEYFRFPVYVRKGMRAYIEAGVSELNKMDFLPLNES